MSLQVWLPLNGSIINQGVAGFQPTAAGITYASSGKIGAKSCSGGSLSMPAAKAATILNNKAITIAFWIKPLANGSAQIFGNDNGMGANNNRKFALWQYPTGQDFHWSWMNDAASATFTTGSVTGAFPLNTWTHLCITYNNPNVTIYVNGEKRTTSSGISNSSTFAYDTTILHSNSNRNINDFRIYDHCLSPREVKLLAQGLVAHYKLDGGNHNNLLVNTCHPSSTANLVGVPSTCSITYDSKLQRNVFTSSTSATSETYIYSSRSPQVTPGVQYTFSCDMWCNDYVKSTEFFWLSDTSNNQKTGTGYTTITNASQSIPIRNQWFHKKWTFTTPSTDYTGYIRIDNNGSSTSGTAAILKVSNLKLEKGNKETPYGLNPNEINSLIEYDCSGYQNHGTCSATPTLTSDTPKYGNSFLFNNNNYIITTRNNFEGMKNTYSLAYWAKHPTSAMTGKMVWGFYDSTNAKYLDIYPVSNKFTLNNGGAGANLPFNVNCPTDGSWHHYAVVGDVNKVYLYIDGIYKGQTSALYEIPNAPLVLSGWTSKNEYRWNDGQISDFRLYATALSETAVKELYQSSISFLDNGTLQCSEIVENNTNLKYNQNGITQAGLISEVGYTNKMKIKTLPDGSAWARIHWLDVSSNTTYYTTEAEVQECINQPNRFSLMRYIDKFKSIENKYEFMLMYPKLSASAYNRWTQTSSPNKTGSVEGVNHITTSWNTYNGGIRKYSGSAAYHCSGDAGWYAPIGQFGRWTLNSTSQIPASNGSSTTEIELWVRIDNLPKLTKLSMLDNAIQAFQIYEL